MSFVFFFHLIRYSRVSGLMVTVLHLSRVHIHIRLGILFSSFFIRTVNNIRSTHARVIISTRIRVYF